MKPGIEMTDYYSYFTMHWRGWQEFGWAVYEKDRNFIIESKANCYNDLLHEAIHMKQEELDAVGGTPFHEPRTYYGSFKEAYTHANAEWAGARYASEQFSEFSRYRAHRCQDVRTLPEERSEYDLKLWRISHPDPLTNLQKQLWIIINEVARTEPWAWPMMIGVMDVSLPVVGMIREKFIALGNSQEEFMKTHKELYDLLQWDSAKGM
jgi:hypothetical protein